MTDIISLKKHIIQVALQGKLTKQESSTESIDSLLPYLFKRNKKYSTFSEDLVEFEIPKSWKWCMTYEAVSLENGDDSSGENLPYLDVKYLRTGKNPTILNKGEVVYPGSKVILVDGENSGEIFAVSQKGYKGSTFKILNISKAFISEYILYFISLYKEKFRGNKTGSAIPHLNKTIFFELPIPLPPIQEQKKIVEKLDRIFEELNFFDKKQSRLAFLRDKLETKILDLAMRGILVKERASSNTDKVNHLLENISSHRDEMIKLGVAKKDKRLLINDPIERDDLFTIPSNWKYVYLGNILFKLTDGTHSTPKYTDDGVKFVSVKDMSSGVLDLSNTKHISQEEHDELFKRCDPKKGDMLLSKVGTTGVPAIIYTDEEFSLFVSVALLKYNHDFIYEKFLYYLIKSPIVQRQAAEHTRGVGNQNWVLDAIAKTIIPLPPFEEQVLIANKIDELIPLCEKLI